MDRDYLTLKRPSASRPSGEWNDDDYDVLAGVVGRIMKAAASPVGFRGCGRSSSAITKIAPRRTAMRQRARLRWRPSPRAGGGNRPALP
jgi:hypothetical protein